MSVSQASIGLQLYPNWNNIAWTQPGGKGTAVFPAQTNGPFTAYPVPGQVIDDLGQALWLFGCGHGVDVIRVFKDFDPTTGLSAACICCSVCSYIQYLVEPAEDATISIAMTLK